MFIHTNLVKYILSILIFGLLPCILLGQQNIEIEVDKIDSKKVAKYLQEKDLTDSNAFHNFKTVCSNKIDSSYSYHKETFVYNAPLDEVWQAYTTSKIDDIWNSKKVALGAGFSTSNNAFCYKSQIEDQMIEDGLVVVTKLRLALGLLKIVVSHKVTNMNEEEKDIEFCYMKGGKTEGSQILHFEEGPNNTTLISHVTKYKSKSKFRDKRLYPFFHSKAIAQLHKTMQDIVHVSDYPEKAD